MMTRALLLIAVLTLSGCSSGALALLTGGGPNVAANVQAGETNSQTIGRTEIVEQSVRQADRVQQSADQNQVRTEYAEKIIVEQQVNGWWIVAFTLWSLFLFWLPSPGQIGERLSRMWHGR